MAPAQAQDTPQRAPQVCSHCKSIKKGCDKKLPSCSQCIKRRAVCRYGETTPEPRRYGDEVANTGQNIGINGLVSTWTSIPRSVLGTLNPSIRLSILLMNSVSDVLRPEALVPNSTQSATSIDEIFNSQMCHIIKTGGETVESVVAKYFNGVHKWLPIISQKRFCDRLQFSQTIQTADFSVLLLTMHLIAQHPSSDFYADQDRETLYLATKALFTQVQTFTPSSMSLAQASIILARYEHAHGMVEAAYITIGTASRISSAIGIDISQCSQEMQGTDAWFDEEEALATWWGLVICDRIIAFNDGMVGRPFATRPIRDEDYLPLEHTNLAGDIDDIISPVFRYYVSAISLPGVGPFGREAQGIYLMDKVRRHVNSMSADDNTLVALGSELQTLLSTVIDQVDGRWSSFCGAMQALIVGLYVLNQSAVTILDLENRPECARTIRVTLHTVTRMVIDIAREFNKTSDGYNLEVLCPTVHHIARFAQEHIMTCNDFQDLQWQQDLGELKGLLRYFNKRWMIAAQELQVVNKTAEMSMALHS